MAGICFFFVFLLLQVSSSLSSYILLSFSFISQENVLFPASNYLFSRRVLSKTPCIEGNWSFETRWTFDAEQCSIKFHFKKSWFLPNSVSFTFLEWVSARSKLVINSNCLIRSHFNWLEECCDEHVTYLIKMYLWIIKFLFFSFLSLIRTPIP